MTTAADLLAEAESILQSQRDELTMSIQIATDLDADLKPLFNAGAQSAAASIQLLRDLGVAVGTVPALPATFDPDLGKVAGVIGHGETVLLQLHRVIKKIAPPAATTAPPAGVTTT